MTRPPADDDDGVVAAAAAAAAGGGGGAAGGGRRRHGISQSTFDEAVLENQDLFDQSPEEAVRETSDQFRRQGLDLSHLCLSHPETEDGKIEREGRSTFERWTESLDERVDVDGTVAVEATDVERIVEALRGIGDACSGGKRTVVGGEGGAASSRNRSARRTSPDGEGGDDDGDNDDDDVAETEDGEDDDDDAVPSRVDPKGNDDDDGGGGGGGPLAYLSLLQRSGGLYTLMSFLGVRVVGGGDGGGLGDDDDESERILAEVVRALTAVLAAPPSAPPAVVARASDRSTREARSALRDGFSAFERLVGLIDECADLCAGGGGSGDDDADADRGGDGDDDDGSTRSKRRTNLLADLIRLGSATTRGCEKNKVAFVRAGRGSGGGGVDDGRRSGGRGRGRGGVAAVAKSFAVALPPRSASDDDDGAIPRAARIRLLTESCRLLAVLCRFDDFRSSRGERPTGGGGGGGPPNVSSAHDHVLEFHRAGIVPTLHRATVLALEDDEDRSFDGEDDDDDEEEEDGGKATTLLASAALSATRALAVNDEIVQSLVAVGVLTTARRALASSVADDDDDGASDGGERGGASSSSGPSSSSQRRRAERRRRRRRSLASASLGLLRNLCGNDGIKTALCLGSTSSSSSSSSSSTSSVLPSILTAMKRYRSDRTVQEHGCGAVAAMALRRPDNALGIVNERGPDAILAAMRSHPDDVAVQRQGALAIRNVVSRLLATAADDDDGGVGGGGGGGGPAGASSTSSSSVRDAFLDLGAETVLREIAGRHMGSVDESYAALRDLGCDAALIRFDADDVDEDGTVRATKRGPTMFGEAKTNFRPVYEESVGPTDGRGGGGRKKSAVEEAVARHSAAASTSSSSNGR